MKIVGFYRWICPNFEQNQVNRLDRRRRRRRGINIFRIHFGSPTALENGPLPPTWRHHWE